MTGKTGPEAEQLAGAPGGCSAGDRADAADERRRVAIGDARITTPSALTAPFAAYIAHELRSPLSTQRALLELALADRDADTSTWREIAHEVLAACMQQERMLEACLVLTRSEARLDRCELVDISSLTARLLRIADLEGLTVNVRLEPALTHGDEALIERLLHNVLANAVRHNRAGGWIAITAGCSRSQTLFSARPGGGLRVEVAFPRATRPRGDAALSWIA